MAPKRARRTAPSTNANNNGLAQTSADQNPLASSKGARTPNAKRGSAARGAMASARGATAYARGATASARGATASARGATASARGATAAIARGASTSRLGIHPTSRAGRPQRGRGAGPVTANGRRARISTKLKHAAPLNTGPLSTPSGQPAVTVAQATKKKESIRRILQTIAQTMAITEASLSQDPVVRSQQLIHLQHALQFSYDEIAIFIPELDEYSTAAPTIFRPLTGKKLREFTQHLLNMLQIPASNLVTSWPIAKAAIPVTWHVDFNRVLPSAVASMGSYIKPPTTPPVTVYQPLTVTTTPGFNNSQDASFVYASPLRAELLRAGTAFGLNIGKGVYEYLKANVMDDKAPRFRGTEDDNMLAIDIWTILQPIHLAHTSIVPYNQKIAALLYCVGGSVHENLAKFQNLNDRLSYLNGWKFFFNMYGNIPQTIQKLKRDLTEPRVLDNSIDSVATTMNSMQLTMTRLQNLGQDHLETHRTAWLTLTNCFPDIIEHYTLTINEVFSKFTDIVHYYTSDPVGTFVSLQEHVFKRRNTHQQMANTNRVHLFKAPLMTAPLTTGQQAPGRANQPNSMRASGATSPTVQRVSAQNAHASSSYSPPRAAQAPQRNEHLPQYPTYRPMKRENDVPSSSYDNKQEGPRPQRKAPNKPCFMCKEMHFPTDCPLPYVEKRQIFLDRRLCWNCSSSEHFAAQCPSLYHCRNCDPSVAPDRAKHHTVLCPQQPRNEPPHNEFRTPPRYSGPPNNSRGRGYGRGYSRGYSRGFGWHGNRSDSSPRGSPESGAFHRTTPDNNEIERLRAELDRYRAHEAVTQPQTSNVNMAAAPIKQESQPQHPSTSGFSRAIAQQSPVHTSPSTSNSI